MLPEDNQDMTPSSPKPVEKKHRLLVVEDDPATLKLLQHHLEKAGYEVICCCNGKEAVTTLGEIGAKVIIADWSMPEMTGLELCQAVQELRDTSALGATYFILLTAHTEKKKVLEAFEAGADDFVRKPYDIQELLARIRAGERILRLQDELIDRQLELSKANAQFAVLNRKLEKLANTDTLTGLPNRRRVFERLNDAWALAERHNHHLSCIMFDVDHFKRVNDTHGHQTGDMVLRAIAKTVRRLLRRYDICGRIGGEEFLVICPNEPATGAAQLAERLRVHLANQTIHCDDVRINVTISFGVTAMRPEHATPDALIADADSMLYAAKENGRNQIWLSDKSGRRRHLESESAAPTTNQEGDKVIR